MNLCAKCVSNDLLSLFGAVCCTIWSKAVKLNNGCAVEYSEFARKENDYIIVRHRPSSSLLIVRRWFAIFYSFFNRRLHLRKKVFYLVQTIKCHLVMMVSVNRCSTFSFLSLSVCVCVSRWKLSGAITIFNSSIKFDWETFRIGSFRCGLSINHHV